MATTTRPVSDFLSVRSAYAPQFPPSGRTIAFITDITGVPQIWEMPADGGWPRQRTFFDERISGFRWSPTGDAILFSMDTGGDERDQLYLLDNESGEIAALTANPKVMHLLGCWSPSGYEIAYASNARTGTYFDVYVQDMPDGEPRLVFEDDGTNSVVGWSPDGRRIVVSRAESAIYNDLILLDVNTGESRRLTEDGHESAYECAAWSPDSSALYLTTNKGREFKSLARMSIPDGEIDWLAEPEWDVEAVTVAPTGGRLAYVVNEAGFSRLHTMDIASGAESSVDSLPEATLQNARGPGSMDWSHDGMKLAFTVNGPAHNPNVWVVNADTWNTNQVTRSDTGGIPRRAFVSPRLVSYPTFDGRQIPAWLYSPAGIRPTGENPIILHVHGGPESQDRPVFNPIYQYFVHRGYSVLAPNVRGSSGYGRTYIHLDDVRNRMDSVRDLEYAQKWLVSSGWAAEDRIAVMGGSYGGFMTLSAITTYPDLWKAAVELFGIGDFLTFLENTGSYRRRQRSFEYGDPVEDAEFLREISPIHRADAIKCPLMALHGARDPRVPISETEKLVATLSELGQTVEYVRFEDEGHGFVKRPNRITAYTAIADFLDANL